MKLLIKLELAFLAFLVCFLINEEVVFAYKDADVQLKTYVNDYISLFEQECPVKAKERTNVYTVQFGDGNDRWIGICMLRLNGFRVKIDKKWWDEQWYDEDRRQVVYHELTHCFLYKDHVDDPGNYMYPSMAHLSYNVYLPQVKADLQEFCKR